MSAQTHECTPVRQRFFTPGVQVLLVLTGIAAAIALNRFVFGLSAVTNLSDRYPWGLWIAVDVATGVALVAGRFTTAALAYIFHRERYRAVVRPALLTAMLGYTFVGLGLMVDLGRYYNIWHPAWPTMWQGNSVLFIARRVDVDRAVQDAPALVHAGPASIVPAVGNSDSGRISDWYPRGGGEPRCTGYSARLLDVPCVGQSATGVGGAQGMSAAARGDVVGRGDRSLARRGHHGRVVEYLRARGVSA